MCAKQEVKAACGGKHGPEGIVVLPFDLCGDAAKLEEAAGAADAAFGGAGVDYLVHNAGMHGTLQGYSRLFCGFFCFSGAGATCTQCSSLHSKQLQMVNYKTFCDLETCGHR